MKKAILKFCVDDFDNIIKGYDIIKFLDIQLQNGIPTAWAICNIGATKKEKTYNIFKIGTGLHWGTEHWCDENYIGTTQENGYVWHYFWEEQEEFI